MKKILYTFIAFAAMAATLTSCEKEAMEINFTQTDNHISDYSGIIQAIKDQTASLETKLALIEEAIKNQTLTLGQKFDVLNTAVENGVLKLDEMAQKINDLIETMNQPTFYKDPEDNSALYLDPTVWGQLSDEALNETFKDELAQMALTDNGVEQLYQTGSFGNHGIYDYERGLFRAGSVNGVPNTDVTKFLTKYVAKVTKRIFRATNSVSNPDWFPYVTDVNGTKQARTFTLTDLGNGTYRYSCIITLWNGTEWATGYGVYASTSEGN